jgi:hypothetical protein
MKMTGVEYKTVSSEKFDNNIAYHLNKELMMNFVGQ